jgi:hypothetical protein
MTSPISVDGPFHLLPQLRALTAIADERERQDLKFGPAQSLNLEDGTGYGRVNLSYEYEMLLSAAREQNDAGVATFESILREEFCEAMLESDPDKLQKELVQVAAVAVKWIEAIDRRNYVQAYDLGGEA